MYKLLGGLKPNSSVAYNGQENESLFVGSCPHYQDGRQAHTWYKTLKKSFLSRTRGPNAMKLGIYNEDLSIVVCSNYDSWLTLTYFNPRSNLVT